MCQPVSGNNFKIKFKPCFDIFSRSICSVILADINLVARTEGDIITVDGKEYVKLTRFEVSPQFGDVKVYATGLFPDPELSMLPFFIQSFSK